VSLGNYLAVRAVIASKPRGMDARPHVVVDRRWYLFSQLKVVSLRPPNLYLKLTTSKRYRSDFSTSSRRCAEAALSRALFISSGVFTEAFISSSLSVESRRRRLDETGAGGGLVEARQGLKTSTGSRLIRPPVTGKRYLPSTSLARISWYLAISSASRARFSAALIYFSQWSRIFLM
jgi:hypothetical protein